MSFVFHLFIYLYLKIILTTINTSNNNKYMLIQSVRNELSSIFIVIKISICRHVI